MGRRSKDSDRIRGKIKHTAIGLDMADMPFILALSSDGKVSAGVRGCIRAAKFHMTKHGRLPAAYLPHLIATDRATADDYLTRFPEQCPPDYKPLTPDAFAGWDDPE